MKKTVMFVLMLVLTLPVLAKDIVITFDDMPIVRQGASTREMEIKIFNDILNTLDKFKVKAAGFVVGEKITEEYHKNLLKEWVKMGHVIGNHSFSHPDLNKTSIEKYQMDVLKCQKVLTPYLPGVKYFRYPLLHRGDSDQKKQAIYRFLKNEGFQIASVSIDNDEYTFNVPARKAKKDGDREKLQQIKKQYLEHMKERVKFYENLSQKHLGREMKHILLLHSSFLNSLFLGDLLTILKKDGWNFITLEEALKDPVYKFKDDYCGKKGIGWLERISVFE